MMEQQNQQNSATKNPPETKDTPTKDPHGANLPSKKMTKPEISWILYDVGNSAFVLLSTALIPIYFSSIATGSIVVAWGYAETVASLIVAILMPVLGSLADLQGNKKKFFIGFVGTGVVACAALGIPDTAFIFLVFYVVAAVCLNSSMVFYDAFLVDVTTEEKYDQISSHGYAWGYIGSCVPFILCLAVVLAGPSIGIEVAYGMKIAFIITAVWWLIFSIPLIKGVYQKNFKARPTNIVRDTFVGLGHTIKNIVSDKRLLFFVLAYFFYIDGVHTVIRMATSYGTELGIDSTQLVLALLVTQFVAFPAAIIYGKLAKKFSAHKMIVVGVVAYICITIFAAFFMKTAVEFWFLAICVGLFQGGIQALSRSEFGKMIPKEHANEYYGFFDIFGKYAAVLGTFLVATFTQITGNPSMGVLTLVIVFVLGLVFLLKTPKAHQ
jgi:UMF1 family MFS transporter